jgi:hypothetical protein
MSGAAARDGIGPFDPYWSYAIAPPRRRGGWRLRILFAGLMVTAAIGAAALTPGGSPDARRPVAASQPPETAELNEAGDRRDVLSIGALSGDAPGLRLETLHSGGGRATPGLYVAAAEIAAAGGATVEKLGATQRLVTAAGPLEWSELALAGRERGCAAFRFAAGEAAGFRGVICAAAGANIAANEIACLAERIALNKTGKDGALAEALRAPPRRGACRTPLG